MCFSASCLYSKVKKQCTCIRLHTQYLASTDSPRQTEGLHARDRMIRPQLHADFVRILDQFDGCSVAQVCNEMLSVQ